MSGIVSAFLDTAVSSRLATAVNSVQTGYVLGGAQVGSGEDTSYVDVTISAVNTAKSIIFINQWTNTYTSLTGRLLNSTTLRLSHQSSAGAGSRWQVVEYK